MSGVGIIRHGAASGPRAAWLDPAGAIHDLGPAADLPTLSDADGPVVAQDEVVFLPPLFGSRRVFAVGYNYRDHAAELTTPLPEWPNFFIRQPQSLVGHDEPVVKPSRYPSYDYEGELAVVIAIGGRDISAADALKHVYGYTCFLDGSVRQIQTQSLAAGKNFDRSGAMGPWIVPAAEVADGSFRVTTTINGEVRQQAPSSDMVFSVADLIHALSQVMELKSGDVISTGTPAGVGWSFDPPRYLERGDEIDITIDGVGSLRTRVVED